MLIEFLGIPGSGKSTVSHVLADTLRARGFVVAEATYELDKRHRRVARLLLKSVHLLRFFSKRPYEALWYCRCIASTKQKTLVDFAKALFNWLFIGSIIDGQRACFITVLDQGVAQALWSVGYAAQRKTWTDLLSLETKGAVMMPDLVVHVRANFQSVGHRLMARTQRFSRLDGFGKHYSCLFQAQTNSDTIARILQIKGVQVIEINNDDPEQLIAGAQIIEKAVMAMLLGINRPAKPAGDALSCSQ